MAVHGLEGDEDGVLVGRQDELSSQRPREAHPRARHAQHGPPSSIHTFLRPQGVEDAAQRLLLMPSRDAIDDAPREFWDVILSSLGVLAAARRR